MKWSSLLAKDFWIPHNIGNDPRERSVAFAFSMALLFTSATLALYTLWFPFTGEGDPIKHGTNLTGVITMVAASVWFRKRGKLREVILALHILGLIFIFISAARTGGIRSFEMIWAVILPPLGALFLGPRIGLIQLSVVLTAYLAWYVLDLVAPLPVAPEKVLGAGYHWFALSLVTTLASIASAHFVRSMRRTQAELDRVKEQRIEELDALVTQRTHELESVRSEIARDFHDEVGNRLAAIALMARRILGDHPELPQGSRHLLEQVAVQSQDVHREARDFVWAIDSRSDCLGEVMLQVLQQTESSFQRPGQELRIDAGIPEAWFNIHLRAGQGRQLLLILKEVLGNAARHGANAPVHMSLHSTHQAATMSIANQQNAHTIPGTGRGLANIRERMQRLGGEVEFLSDSHFTVHLVVPFPPNGGGKSPETEVA